MNTPYMPGANPLNSEISDFGHCALLNELVIRQHRSLLQYADLCWPWTDLEESDERILLQRLAARQREGIRKLVALLDRRGWPVDYGQFPEEFADLNFVSIDFLWPRIIASEKDLLTKLHQVRKGVQDDPEAEEIVAECIDVQREIIDEICDHELAGPAGHPNGH